MATAGRTGARPRPLSNRLLGTLLPVAIAMLLLAPAISVATWPAVRLVAPFKGTSSSPGASASFGGCSGASSAHPRWSALTGAETLALAANTSTCRGSGGSGSGLSQAFATGGITVVIPFKVGTNGSHAIASNWSVDLASRFSFKAPACPAKNINYHPRLYGSSSAGCFDSSLLLLTFLVAVVDLSNASWPGFQGFTQAYAYHDANFWNSTTCYNPGNVTCVNTTINSSGSRALGLNSPGFGALKWNGMTQFTMWSNATKMSKNDRYSLWLTVYVRADMFTSAVNLLSHWSGSASTSVDMATSPHGAKLNWVSIF
jgi:hypothetical protein